MIHTPKTFISHSSEDNDRFVVPFATRLRERGIDAWLDFWELLPGDSLVDKIWNEGLKECSAFIIVLSNTSIRRPWVREELNTAVVKRIENKTKLIPLRLDNCDVPEPLRSTVWIDIGDPASYDREFERIVNSIYGQYHKPAIGDRPVYTRPDALKINGVPPIDGFILGHACRLAIQLRQADLIEAEQLVSELQQYGISEAQIMETQEVLESRSFIKLYRVLGPPHAYDFGITTAGFDQFARSGGIPNYNAVLSDVAHCLVQQSALNNEAVAKALNQPIRIVEHTFESLADHGLIKYARSMGGDLSGLFMDVFWVSPELRRNLEATA